MRLELFISWDTWILTNLFCCSIHSTSEHDISVVLWRNKLRRSFEIYTALNVATLTCLCLQTLVLVHKFEFRRKEEMNGCRTLRAAFFQGIYWWYILCILDMKIFKHISINVTSGIWKKGQGSIRFLW